VLETLRDSLGVRAFVGRIDDIRGIRCLRVEHPNPGRDQAGHPGQGYRGYGSSAPRAPTPPSGLPEWRGAQPLRGLGNLLLWKLELTRFG